MLSATTFGLEAAAVDDDEVGALDLLLLLSLLLPAVKPFGPPLPPPRRLGIFSSAYQVMKGGHLESSRRNNLLIQGQEALLLGTTSQQLRTVDSTFRPPELLLSARSVLSLLRMQGIV